MEIFHERRRFLYKYKDHLDFVLLTANISVSDQLIHDTPDLPWNLDANGKRLNVPSDYMENIRKKHATENGNGWNYIESACYWTWEYWSDSLEFTMADPRWPEQGYGRWFFQHWSNNQALMNISDSKLCDSIKKYIAATKIQRTFKRCVTNPHHPMCKSRLMREFNSLAGELPH